MDFLRCSVTFDSVGDMLAGMNELIRLVSTDDALCIKQILRLKNGFKDIKAWGNDLNNYDYRDVKFNVLVCINKEFLICEVQFLLGWLLKAKKKAHKLYNIKRKKQYIYNVSQFCKIDLNYKTYKAKVDKLIANNNITHFFRELVMSPNIILSIISSNNRGDSVLYPLMYSLGGNIKLFQLFYQCMHNFAIKLLGDKDGNEYLSKYLNYNNCYCLIAYNTFWGIGTMGLNTKSTQYQLIETIMKSDNFKGLSHVKSSEEILYRCTYIGGSDEFLALILKYGDKNEASIADGLRFYKKGYGGYAVTTLVSRRHCNEERLKQLLFGFGKFSKNTQIDSDILQEAFDIAKHERKMDNWASIILKYAKDIGVELNEEPAVNNGMGGGPFGGGPFGGGPFGGGGARMGGNGNRYNGADMTARMLMMMLGGGGAGTGT